MTENNRILIVDDDPGIRETYQKILSPTLTANIMAQSASLFGEQERNSGQAAQIRYELTIAADGIEGVKAAEMAINDHQPFAVAFVDMQMPGIDGAETSKRLWDVEPDLKIIIVTAHSEYKPNNIIRVAGRDDLFYLHKPFNAEEIQQFARALTYQWNLERERESLSERLHKVNEELEDMNTHLHQKVQEQTVQLIQSEKMASIGILAAGVAHEINNPIAFINVNLSAIKKYSTRIHDLLLKYDNLEQALRHERTGHIPPLLEDISRFKDAQKIDFILNDMEELAEESLEGGQRIRDIVEDLQTFSRTDNAEFEYIDLHEILEATLSIIRNELKSKADILKDYGTLPEVKCFPRKISQVFMNILMNAAQAIEHKGTIRIVTRHVREGSKVSDEKVEIRISDSGCGISETEMSKIFDPFFTTKPVGQGTGLGLSITYDIINAHGGTIKVESEEGAGTAFTITLPLETL